MDVEIYKIYKDSRGYDKLGRRITNGYLYEVSNLGNVKVDGIIYIFDDNIKGYFRIGHFNVHVAVAELFVKKPETYKRLCVDHIDGNQHNNKADNLRWVTWSGNALNPATHCNINPHKWTKDEKQNISEKVSEYNTHCCWIHLGDKTKFVHEDYLNYWLDDGWLYGRKQKNNKQRNRHRVYDNEEHTKWHMVDNN